MARRAGGGNNAFSFDLARQGEEADQVGQHHQAVEGVGQGPHGGKAGGAPRQDQGQKGQPVGPDRLRAEEIAPALGAVLAPAQHRRPGKQEHRRRRKARPERAHRGGKGRAGHLGGRDAAVQPGGQDGQGGHGADQKGGDKDLKDPPHPLPGGLPGGGRAAGDGRRAQPRLAGKAAAHKPPADGRRRAAAHHAAPGRPQAECAPQDAVQGRRQGGRMGQDDEGRPGQVKRRHQGHQPAGGRGHPFHPAQQDQGGDGGQSRPRQGRGEAEGPLQAAGNGVHLGEVADAEGGQQAEQGESPRQSPPQGAAMGLCPQPGRKVVHRAAVPAAAPKAPVSQAQQVFGVGGHHPEQGHHPHPEDGPRPAACKGRAHPDHAAGADGGPQGGAEALERADAARFLLREVGAAPQDDPQRLPQPEGQAGQLKKAGPHRQPDPGRGQQPHPRRAPERRVHRIQQLHHPNSPRTQKTGALPPWQGSCYLYAGRKAVMPVWSGGRSSGPSGAAARPGRGRGGRRGTAAPRRRSRPGC